MAMMKGSQRSSPHKDHLYDFCIKFLRITGISLPIRAESSNTRNRYFLKITLLHGTEQQKIGEFEVVGDVCIVNHQLSCQIAYGRPEKLHVYIDQNWSAGLSGHITVDLKEFFEDVDAEIYLEYPLFSSRTSHVQQTTTLEMSVLCTSSTKLTTYLNNAQSNQEFMRFEDISQLRPSLDDFWYPPDLPDLERSNEDSSILLGGVLKQVSPPNNCLAKIDREIEMLKEMEGQYRNVPTRPDVLAAAYFAAGMAFQRQVDRVNKLRMYGGAEDPLLLGESSRLLLEDVSPSSRSASSRNPEADSFCQSSSRSLVLSESSSNGYGHGPSCSEAATSLAGDIDDDESDRIYLDSVCLGDPELPLSHLGSKSETLPTDKSSPPGESKDELSIVKNEASIRLSKHNVLNSVGSVLSALTISKLSSSGLKDVKSRGSKEDEVTVAGSMLGRQEVTSIQTIRRSNPGLGWLSYSNQLK
jgi:hypothetical protein